MIKLINKLKKLFCTHPNHELEIHIKEKHIKTFEKTNIKLVCCKCGKGKYLPGTYPTTVHIWTSKRGNLENE